MKTFTKISAFVLVFCAGAALSAAASGLVELPGDHSTLRKYSEQLESDLSGGELLSESDSHGGFHGDGVTITAIRFNGDEFAQRTAASEGWKPLPMDETSQALAYGCEIDGCFCGPYLKDDATDEVLLPEITNGCYRLIDRQTDAAASEQGILDRSSLNFTLAVYDADCQTLYICEMDT